MILALLVFFSMLPMDIAAAAKISFLDRHRPWMAGHMEVVNDWGGALSYGIGGASVFRYGLSMTTVVIFLALGCASELGTRIGYGLTNRRGSHEGPQLDQHPVAAPARASRVQAVGGRLRRLRAAHGSSRI